MNDPSPGDRHQPQLDDEQLEAFDAEFVNDDRWRVVAPRILHAFGDRPFRCIDVGGGNGRFADRLLGEFPNAQVVVLEPGASLLEKNVPHPRKTCVLGGADRLGGLGEADLVTFNWVLHHLVARRYGASAELATGALRAARSAVGPDGHVSVFEISYDGWPIRSAPGHLTFLATRSTLFRGLARRAGATTAGVGVAFRSASQWRALFERAGLRIDAATETPAQAPALIERSALVRRALMLTGLRTGHWWLSTEPA